MALSQRLRVLRPKGAVGDERQQLLKLVRLHALLPGFDQQARRARALLAHDEGGGVDRAPVLELGFVGAVLGLEGDLDLFKGGHDDQGLGHARRQPSQHAAAGGQAALLVPQQPLVERVGAHAQRVLEGEVGGERGEPLPEGGDALLRDDRPAAVRDARVPPAVVQLEPGLDDVDGLQAAGFHDAADGA